MNDPTLQGRIAALRGAGAGRRDPLRFGALEALARRLEGQPEPVRHLLATRLAAALSQYEQGLAAAPAAAPARRAAVPHPAPATPLALLNAQLRDAAAARLAAAAPGEPTHEHELASARRFRQAWQASRTVQQVEQALERRPANAGPLNSHALVLQALALMRDLSPEYLRRFLGHVESLQWLEQAREAQPAARPRAAVKPAKAVKTAKAARPRRKGPSGDV
jgi:hypothetical protein